MTCLFVAYQVKIPSGMQISLKGIQERHQKQDDACKRKGKQGTKTFRQLLIPINRET